MGYGVLKKIHFTHRMEVYTTGSLIKKTCATYVTCSIFSLIGYALRVFAWVTQGGSALLRINVATGNPVLESQQRLGIEVLTARQLNWPDDHSL